MESKGIGSLPLSIDMYIILIEMSMHPLRRACLKQTKFCMGTLSTELGQAKCFIPKNVIHFSEKRQFKICKIGMHTIHTYTSTQ